MPWVAGEKAKPEEDQGTQRQVKQGRTINRD